jgi:serine protease Do
MTKVVPSLTSMSVYEHPYIGISGIDVSSEIANAIKLNETNGFLVSDITSGGPAFKAGIRGGDVLTDVNGTEIELGGDVIVGIDNTTVRKIDDMLSYLETEKQVGDTVALTVVRDGKPQKIYVTLSARPVSQQQQQQLLQPSQQQQKPSLGISGVNVAPEIAETMNLTQATGFLVLDVIGEGPADKAGVRGGYTVANINGTEIELGGDVIVGIDNTTVRKIDDIQSYLNSKKIGDTIQVKVIRDGKIQDISLTLGSVSSTLNNRSISPLLPNSDVVPSPDTQLRPLLPDSLDNDLQRWTKLLFLFKQAAK